MGEGNWDSNRIIGTRPMKIVGGGVTGFIFATLILSFSVESQSTPDKKTSMNQLRFNFLLPLTFVFTSCTDNGGAANKAAADKATDSTVAKNSVPPGSFDLTKPDHTWQLPGQLVEVSGNAWIDATHLLLIEDLHPALYIVKLDDK